MSFGYDFDFMEMTIKDSESAVMSHQALCLIADYIARRAPEGDPVSRELTHLLPKLKACLEDMQRSHTRLVDAVKYSQEQDLADDEVHTDFDNQLAGYVAHASAPVEEEIPAETSAADHSNEAAGHGTPMTPATSNESDDDTSADDSQDHSEEIEQD